MLLDHLDLGVSLSRGVGGESLTSVFTQSSFIPVLYILYFPLTGVFNVPISYPFFLWRHLCGLVFTHGGWG